MTGGPTDHDDEALAQRLADQYADDHGPGASSSPDTLAPHDTPPEDDEDYADAVEGDAPLPATEGDPGAGDAAPAFQEPTD